MAATATEELLKTPLEVAKVGATPAAGLAPSAILVEGLSEGHIYQLVGGRLIECERAHLGPVRPPRPPLNHNCKISAWPQQFL